MDKLKPCPYCGEPLYIKVKRYTKPLLMPATRAGVLRDELIDITGEEYVPIKAKYCPLCGRALGRALDRRAESIEPSSRSADALKKLILDIEDRMTLDTRERVALHDAVAALRHAEPENKPLTLEQLKNMHGEAIWVKDLVINEIQCLQFDGFKPATYHKGDDVRFNQFGTETGVIWWCCKYGKTWLAYACEPRAGIDPKTPENGSTTAENGARNKPLTLDELRKMNDERVWVQFPSIGMYGLVAYHSDPDDDRDGDNVYITNNFGGRNTIDEILKQHGTVYARKPEGSEKG